MKSKWTKSSIPNFFSCSTTEPKFDLKYSNMTTYLMYRSLISECQCIHTPQNLGVSLLDHLLFVRLLSV